MPEKQTSSTKHDEVDIPLSVPNAPVSPMFFHASQNSSLTINAI